uniref:Palmitoyltransferase n=1 Tax=Odontella aurita TaxID=265563 RepID=A0A7S4MTU8_9STRA
MNLTVWLTLYLSGFAFFTYACIVADPDKSPVAKLLTQTLPGYALSGLRRLAGPKVASSFESVAEMGLVIVYLLIVLGCWSIIFTHAYDLITSSTHVSDGHKYSGYMVFVACMGSWRYASRASPGIVTARTLVRYDNYPYDDLLFPRDRICPTVKIRKLARSKYDWVTNQHIPRFDHFCGWINNAVGEENYRWFLLFLAVHVGMCFYGSIVCYWLFVGEIIDGDLLNATFFVVETGEEVKASKMVVVQFLLARHFYLSACFICMVVMGVALTLFLGFHLYLSARGMTTNEYYKWKQVIRWHKSAKRRYEEAKKEGLVTERQTQGEGKAVSSATISDDVDVGCVGPAGTSVAGDAKAASTQTGANGDRGKEGDDDDDSAILDPGPFPKNIYDRGIRENFGEIIYPRSLREDATSRWRSHLRKGGVKPSRVEPDLAVLNKPKAT